MWFKHKAWISSVAGLPTNVVAVWFAARPGETWHATGHGCWPFCSVSGRNALRRGRQSTLSADVRDVARAGSTASQGRAATGGADIGGDRRRGERIGRASAISRRSSPSATHASRRQSAPRPNPPVNQDRLRPRWLLPPFMTSTFPSPRAFVRRVGAASCTTRERRSRARRAPR